MKTLIDFLVVDEASLGHVFQNELLVLGAVRTMSAGMHHRGGTGDSYVARYT
jgi:hypothetical protein